MNELIIYEDIKIENMIYEIRGKQVMLSSDVANAYKVETKVLNQTIKRNINRFPEEFCFQLTDKEISELSLRSQFVTLNKSNNLRGQHYKYNPYVLTEQGIMMLSGLLKSDVAVEVNIKIINAFVKMRKYISSDILSGSEILLSHENRLLKVEHAIDRLSNGKDVSGIYYKGQIYDAYSAVIKICKKARNRLIIIDNFSDENLLDIISKLDVEVILITDKKNTYLKLTDIDKYNEEYHNLKVVYDNSFHDRFFIIDDKEIYHCGSSINRVGYKTFAINKIEDEIIINRFMDEVDLVVESDNESKVGLDE